MKFYRNWYELAESRDTDEKRLAFYDAIFRYAFDGVIPPKPERGVSPGAAWAAYDGYLTAQPILDDEAAKSAGKAEAGRKGGAAGKDVSRNVGNHNRSKQKAKTKAQSIANSKAEINSKSKAESIAPINSRKKAIQKHPLYKVEVEVKDKVEGKRESKRENALSHPHDEPEEVQATNKSEPPTLKTVLAVAADRSQHSGGEAIPEEFVRRWYALMQDAGWRDTRGTQIALGWRMKLALAWRDEQKRRQTAKNGPVPQNLQGGEDDYADRF